jgi:hypothetical protein
MTLPLVLPDHSDPSYRPSLHFWRTGLRYRDADVLYRGYSASSRSNLLPPLRPGGPEIGVGFAPRRDVRSILPARGGQCTQRVISPSTWTWQLLSAQKSRPRRCQERGSLWVPFRWYTPLQLQLMHLSLGCDSEDFGCQICGHVSWWST